jgi:hypothetical protein
MTGTALPAILIELGSQRYPLSLRNVLGVVVDHWATRNASNTSNVDLTAPIAAFLQQRLDSRNIFAGPFTLVTRKRRLSHRFAAAILGEAKLHFIAVLNEKAVSLLVNIERDLRNLLASGEEWAVSFEDRRRMVRLRDQDGTSQATLPSLLSFLTLPPLSLACAYRKRKPSFCGCLTSSRSSTRWRTLPSSTDSGLTSAIIKISWAPCPREWRIFSRCFATHMDCWWMEPLRRIESTSIRIGVLTGDTISSPSSGRTRPAVPRRFGHPLES